MTGETKPHKTILELSQLDRPESGVLALTDDLILAAYRGSHAHGMYVPPSDSNSIDDTDIMALAVGGKRDYLGLSEWGTRGTRQFWQGHYDCVYYELRKAFKLLLQGNPNILSLLWLHPQSYLVEQPEGKRLLRERNLFVGKHIYQAFAGYAQGQLLKMEVREPAEIREYLGVTYELKLRGIHPTDQGLPQDWQTGDYVDCHLWSNDKLMARYIHYTRKGENLGYLGDKRKRLVLEHGYDSKNAAHCIRLLKMGIEFLQTGSMTVYRVADREELLAIKAGKWPLEQVKQLAHDLFAEAEKQYFKSTLPDEPQKEKAEQLLVELIESYWSRK